MFEASNAEGAGTHPGRGRRASTAAVLFALVLLCAAAGAGGAGASPMRLQRGAQQLALCEAATPGLCAAPSTPAAAATLWVGTQKLTRCQSSPLAYCGSLAVPLDYSMPSGPHISIAYRWYPASALVGSPLGTVLPVEGGPGYASIGSVESGYAVQYGPLLTRWNMLAIDNRGTGSSTPVDCPAIQNFSGPTGTSAFQQAAAGCAASLNHRWKYPGGGWVHASDLFSSAPAAEDMASVIQALDVPKVDLYGDSYGSFFAQVFASRFPALVRSVILDSTYQAVGLDPWYRSAVTSMPGAFAAACARAPTCAAAAPGSAWARIARLAEYLRASPVSGRVPGPAGTLVNTSMGVVGLVDLVNDAAADPQMLRALDAAGRALLGAHDPAPLLRLYDERLAEDEAYAGVPATQYSAGLYLAVSCLDYPQLFDMHATSAVREGELQAAEAALPPSTFSPFSTAEWLQQNQNTEAYTACLDWPSPTVAQPPTAGVLPLFPPSLPVLVLGGEFDTWTPPGDVSKVLAEIGGHARFIELRNATHVVGEGDTLCGSALIRAFVGDPSQLDTLDASCAAQGPPIHSVGVFAEQLGEQPPIEPTGTSTHAPAALRLAAAAVATAGDAVARHGAIEARLDHGLHGGQVAVGGGGQTLRLTGDQLVPGVAVSGTIRLTAAADPLEGQSVIAQLAANAPGVRGASFTAGWNTQGAQAQVVGTVGGEPVAGTMPAP
jgi:pimeloyl-ACP methyl ester carboxylesterase